MKHKLFILLVVYASFISYTYAQHRTITGVVTHSKDGKPIGGVSVFANGSHHTTQTSEDGKYSIRVDVDVRTLTFKFLGLNSVTQSINAERVINVVMQSDESDLSEVVVLGYGNIRRTDLTGSVSTIKGESFQDKAISSFDKFLQGQSAGVHATTPSGVLGSAARVRIRGANSISNGSDPLYVVDGVPYMINDINPLSVSNPLADINPNDIASVEVLKDGAATAIYGSRAANGVILITTKRGQFGAPKLEYSNWFAVASPSKRFDLLNANEFIEITNEKLRNAGLDDAAFPTPIPGQEGQFYDTDWQNIIFRRAFQQSHSLSLSGANEKTNYFLSMGYANMEGILYPNSLKRYSLRTRIEQKVFNDRLTIGVNNSVAHTANRGLNTAGSATSSVIQGAIFAFPNVAAVHPDGTYNLSDDQFTLGQGANTRPVRGNVNQAFVLDNNIYKYQQLNVTGNAFADVKIMDGLNFRTQIGINYLLGEDYLYFDPRHGDGRSVSGRIAQYFLPKLRYNWQNLLTYDKVLGDHSINAVIGQEMQKTSRRFFASAGTGLSSTYFGENENLISGSLSNQVVTGSSAQNAFESLFGRAHYTYKRRYLISATLRNDRLSSLPLGNQSATLPGASVGWNISEEDFFRSSFISNLKIRGSWAKVGNTEIGDYPFAGVFSGTTYGTFNGILYSQVSNPDLRFETSQKLDIGLDIGLFNNRVSMIVDYFNNNIDNLILAAPTPPSLGVPSNQINRNIGAMYNRGFEFSINSSNIEREHFSWRSNFNITLLKNRVQRLVDNQPINYLYHTVREGEAFASFYGYVSRGVNSANGNPLFERADGTIIQRAFGNNGNWSIYNPDNEADESQITNALTAAD